MDKTASTLVRGGRENLHASFQCPDNLYSKCPVSFCYNRTVFFSSWSRLNGLTLRHPELPSRFVAAPWRLSRLQRLALSLQYHHSSTRTRPQSDKASTPHTVFGMAGMLNSPRPLAETLICVSPPGGDPGEGTPITEPPPTPTEDPATPVPKPTNGKDESNYPCAKWYTIQDGDYCESVSIRESIALRDFYFLNPSINEQCTNLLLDIAYCVAAVGDINTYPSYPHSTPPLYTLTSATYSTTTQTLSTWRRA